MRLPVARWAHTYPFVRALNFGRQRALFARHDRALAVLIHQVLALVVLQRSPAATLGAAAGTRFLVVALLGQCTRVQAGPDAGAGVACSDSKETGTRKR